MSVEYEFEWRCPLANLGGLVIAVTVEEIVVFGAVEVSWVDVVVG